MKIDNFEKINRLLEFTSEDDFFYLQIIKRRKDNPDLPRSEKVIRNYYLRKGDLEKHKDGIINLCKSNNARAYFRLNKRNYKDIAFKMNLKLANHLCNNQYKACENLFDSVAGETHSAENKSWIIDIDETDSKVSLKYYEIIKNINSDAIICTIPTINGFHIITKPFNTALFNQNCIIEKIETPAIHKDNPTLLYFDGPSSGGLMKIVNRIKEQISNKKCI